jgi:hypothetical protein
LTDKKEWKVLSFRDAAAVPASSVEDRTAHIRARAMEKFGLANGDFNPGNTPAYPGTTSLRDIENGGTVTLHVFEVQITKAAAARLAVQHHPDLMLVSDVVERKQPATGAFDPRKLPKGPKIKY